MRGQGAFLVVLGSYAQSGLCHARDPRPSCVFSVPGTSQRAQLTKLKSVLGRLEVCAAHTLSLCSYLRGTELSTQIKCFWNGSLAPGAQPLLTRHLVTRVPRFATLELQGGPLLAQRPYFQQDKLPWGLGLGSSDLILNV